MQNGKSARSTQRLFRILRPDNVGTAAQTAITWLKPPPSQPGAIKPIRLPGHSAALGRLGSLEVRLAEGKREIKRAQKLRYRVFYKDGTAIADAATLLARRDKDAFDKICDHLLVIDRAAKPSIGGKLPVVGTYRLLRQDVAESHGGFYTENEFDIAGLIERHSNLRFLELGRSCVLPRYRNKRTVELLWHGIWSYVTAAPARRHDRLRQFRGHRSRPAGAAFVVPASLRAGPRSLARLGASLAPHRYEPDGEGSHQPEGRAA